LVALGCGEGELAEEFSGCGVDDSDIEVVDQGSVTIMVTHSPRDTEALPKPEDRAKAAGLMERCDTLILGASSHNELRPSERAADDPKAAEALA
jgi:hypothetical protein